jgi:hypothetical protein
VRPQGIRRLVDARSQLALSGTKMSDVADHLQGLGYKAAGIRRFNYKSGEHYWDARTLASQATELGRRRHELLQRHGGKHPSFEHQDWTEWEETTMLVAASAKGARLLGVASLEAFVNEVLSQRFPNDYEELETGRRASPLRKLRRLCERLDIPRGERWLSCLEANMEPRRQIVHHKPGYVDDYSAPDSVELAKPANPEAVEDFLACLDQAYEELFARFGLSVPPTHLPPDPYLYHQAWE